MGRPSVTARVVQVQVADNDGFNVVYGVPRCLEDVVQSVFIGIPRDSEDFLHRRACLYLS